MPHAFTRRFVYRLFEVIQLGIRRRHFEEEIE